MSDKNNFNTIIAGAGDIGSRVAAALIGKSREVLTISRRARAMPVGVRHMVANLVDGEGLGQVPRQAHALIYCVAPDQRTPEAYRRLYVDGLNRMLGQCQFERLILVSSSAVYGQDEGEWIDEKSPAIASTFNGQILREAEVICSAHKNASALRFTGIYGPGRTSMLRRALAGEAGRPHWTNRIHVEDGVAAITHVLGLAQPAPLYCVSDDCPVLESELLAWLRMPQNNAGTAPAIDTTGRRVSNQLLKASGWLPRYPSYKEGYQQLLGHAGV